MWSCQVSQYCSVVQNVTISQPTRMFYHSTQNSGKEFAVSCYFVNPNDLGRVIFHIHTVRCLVFSLQCCFMCLSNDLTQIVFDPEKRGGTDCLLCFVFVKRKNVSRFLGAVWAPLLTWPAWKIYTQTGVFHPFRTEITTPLNFRRYGNSLWSRWVQISFCVQIFFRCLCLVLGLS